MAVIWRQWVEGFDAMNQGTGCTVTIDSAGVGRDKNKLTSTIANATDTEDEATGLVAMTAYLPAGDQGRIRFKWKPLAYPPGDPWNPLDNAIFMQIGRTTPTVEVFETYAEPDQQIAMFSRAGTLRATNVSEENTGPVTVAGQEYTVEVAWKGATDGSGLCRVWLDESLIHEFTGLTMGSVGSCSVTNLALGFHHYDGTDTEGLSCEIRWAQLSDDHLETLVDPPLEQDAFMPSGRRGGN